MSVVFRIIENKEYLHIRRKVNGHQKQRFMNVTGLSPKELAICKHKAKKIDYEWGLEQGVDDSILSVFTKGGVDKCCRTLTHLYIAKPNKKSDWSVKFVIHKPLVTCSRSIPKRGLTSAIKSAFSVLAKHIGLSKRNNVHYNVIEALYIQKLKADYYALKKEYKGVV
jgi:hypothetical protein